MYMKGGIQTLGKTRLALRVYHSCISQPSFHPATTTWWQLGRIICSHVSFLSCQIFPFDFSPGIPRRTSDLFVIAALDEDEPPKNYLARTELQQKAMVSSLGTVTQVQLIIITNHLALRNTLSIKPDIFLLIPCISSLRKT